MGGKQRESFEAKQEELLAGLDRALIDARLSTVPETLLENGDSGSLGQSSSRSRDDATLMNSKGDEDALPLHELDTANDTQDRRVQCVINLSMAINVTLFVLKIVAVALSGALVLWTSVADSFLDLLSGSIVFIVSRVQRRTKLTYFPIGRSRLEGLGILIFSTVMGMTSFQLIIEGIKAIASGVKDPPTDQNPGGVVTYAVLFVVVGLKIAAYIISIGPSRYSASVKALRQDHRNDIATNSLSLLVVYLIARREDLWWLDPAASILFSLFLVAGWAATGKEHIDSLSGKAASQVVTSRILWVTLHSSPAILQVDTVRAYHMGEHVFAEVDIVLPEQMPLHEAHEIGENLTLQLERLPEVERAFVHLDVDSTHNPRKEHIYPSERARVAQRRQDAAMSPHPPSERLRLESQSSLAYSRQRPAQLPERSAEAMSLAIV